MNEDKGAAFVVGDSPVEFKGENGQLTGVVLQSGKVLEADVCLLGLGVTPSTEFLKGSGFNMTERGEVVVDEVCNLLINTTPNSFPCHLLHSRLMYAYLV